MTGSWLQNRLADVPEALASTLRDAPDDLVEASVAALERAQSQAGDRSGAEPLLTADALITYACQRALEDERPEQVWNHLLERIGQESE